MSWTLDVGAQEVHRKFLWEIVLESSHLDNWGDVKLDLREMECDDVEWIGVAQDDVQWWTLNFGLSAADSYIILPDTWLFLHTPKILWDKSGNPVQGQ